VIALSFLLLAPLIFLSGRIQSKDQSHITTLPVVIFDDNARVTGRAVSSETNNILTENRIKIYPEDAVTRELILDPVADGGAGEKIIIKRAPVFTVSVDDQEKTIRSWAKDIRGVLDGHVALGVKDIVAPALSAPAIPGEIIVTRINVVEEEKNVTVPFATSIKKDYWIAKGKNKVITAGVNGQRKQIYKVTYKNGIEVSRVLISQSTIGVPVTEVLLRGVMPTNDKYGHWPTIVAAASKYGVDAEEMFNVMMCESKGYTYAGSTYKGVFQYHPDTWSGASRLAGYPNADIYDAKAQIYVTAWKVSREGWRAWGCKP
jgi:hypothetical protein